MGYWTSVRAGGTSIRAMMGPREEEGQESEGEEGWPGPP